MLAPPHSKPLKPCSHARQANGYPLDGLHGIVVAPSATYAESIKFLHESFPLLNNSNHSGSELFGLVNYWALSVVGHLSSPLHASDSERPNMPPPLGIEHRIDATIRPRFQVNYWLVYACPSAMFFHVDSPLVRGFSPSRLGCLRVLSRLLSY